MFRRAFAAAVAASALTGTIAQKAGNGEKCPEDSPCCGLYNDCGVGAFCVQGCDPVHSHSIEACLPNPQCKNAEYDMTSEGDIVNIENYLGDASKANWVRQGKTVPYDDAGQKGLWLTLAEGTSGTVLSSTHYVWYGKICATMTTSRGAGVVTAFIMMSDAKDEIDFEWVGVDVTHAQTNYYSQGVTDYTKGENLTTTNTFEDIHEYCVDWSPDELKWAIDGKTLRTVTREGTWNSTANRFDYPQTPSRIMLSLWPAGLPTTQKGTRDWAGGLIDWNSEYMMNGYYYAMVQKITVECYKPPSGAKGSGSKTYVYKDRAATNNTIELSNKQVILGSLYATGEDPEEGASSVSSGAKPTKSVNLVPGGNPGGGNRGEDTPEATGGANPTTGGDGGDPEQTQPAGSGNQEFTQGKGQGATLQPGLGKVGGGAIAIVVAVFGLMVL